MVYKIGTRVKILSAKGYSETSNTGKIIGSYGIILKHYEYDKYYILLDGMNINTYPEGLYFNLDDFEIKGENEMKEFTDSLEYGDYLEINLNDSWYKRRYYGKSADGRIIVSPMESPDDLFPSMDSACGNVSFYNPSSCRHISVEMTLEEVSEKLGIPNLHIKE